MKDNEEHKLTELAKIFPKDKSTLAFKGIQRRIYHIIQDDNELTNLLNKLKNVGVISHDMIAGYAITDKGLDLLSKDKTPTDYIIRKLNQNNGVYNFNHLSGKKFKNDTEKFSVIQDLVDKGYIKKVQGALGQTYMLTDKYFVEHIEKYKHEALSLLKDKLNDEVWWSTIVLELDLPEKYGDELKNLLEHDGFVYTSTRTKQGDAVKVKPKVTAYFYKSEKQTEHKMPASEKELRQNYIQSVSDYAKSIPTGKENGTLKNRKIEYGIILTIIGGAFGLGFYFGINRFDKEKNELYFENVHLKDSIKEIHFIIEGQQKISNKLKSQIAIEEAVKRLNDSTR